MKKGIENLEVLGKFYFKSDKILNKICENQEQILKKLEVLYIMLFYETQYKIKTEIIYS